MQTFDYVLTDAAGLHARPAGALVKKAKEYACRITVSANGKSCDATRLMALMGMGARGGTTVTVQIEGDDECACLADLTEFFKQNL